MIIATWRRDISERTTEPDELRPSRSVPEREQIMQIKVTYDSTVTSQSNAAQIEGAIQAAVQFYEAAFTNNNITINIDFQYASLGAGAAAENSFSYETFTYSQIVNALKANDTSAVDAEAYLTLPVSDPTGGSGDDYALTTAQARALGLSSFTPTFDDVVTLNSNLSWDFNPYNRSVPGEYDAIGALEHEMSEGGMGRIGSMGTYIASGVWTPLDLFRYSAPGVRQLTPNASVNGFFSLNGQQLLTEYNNPTNGGDATDWLPSIQGDSYGDAYQGLEGRVNLTDLQEDEIMGWHLDTASNDLTHSGISDILVENGSGNLTAFLMNSNGNVQSADGLTTLPSGWQVVGTGDFNGAGNSDLLVEQASSGDLSELLMNSSGQIQSAVGLTVLPSGWQVEGVGDFAGDGITDVLLEQPSSGDLSEFMMNDQGQIQSAVGLTVLPSGWQVEGVGDFAGNGISDILLEQPSSGDLSEFLMNSSGQIQSAVGLTVLPSGWQVEGVGDFTGNGISDILLEQASTGELSEYLMNSSGQIQSVAGLTQLPSGWQVEGTGEYTGNGISDVLLEQPSTGNMSEYLLNSSGQIQSVVGVTTLPSGWQALNTHNAPTVA
jgi:hypothetical protein